MSMCLKKNIIFIQFLFIANFTFSQSVYFNNRYELINGWSDVTKTIIDLDSVYLIAGGAVHVPTNKYPLGLIIINNSGQIQQTKIYGGTQYQFTGYGSGGTIHTKDNGFLFTGQVQDSTFSFTSGYLFKVDENLDSLWFILHDTTYVNYFSQAKQLPDSGFILAGADEQFGNRQIFFLKADKIGNIIWRKRYDIGNGTDVALSIDTTQDGGFIIAGMMEVVGTATWDGYVIKTDSSGDFQWQRTFGTFDETDVATSVKSTANGDILVAGSEWKYNITPGNFDYYQGFIARLDINNNLLWKRSYGTPSEVYQLESVKELKDSSIVAIGVLIDTMSNYNVCMLVKTNANGDVIWLREYFRYTDAIESHNYFWDFVPTSDGGFAIAGHILVLDFPNPYQDAWVLKLDSMGCPYPECDTATGILEINPYLSYGEIAKVFPNPATDNITVTGYYSLPATFNIYNIEGKLLLQKTITTHYENINIDTILRGVCIYTVDDGKGNIYKGKFIIR